MKAETSAMLCLLLDGVGGLAAGLRRPSAGGLGRSSGFQRPTNKGYMLTSVVQEMLVRSSSIVS